ncbi:MULTISPECIES: hypothetical protein [unclassified Bradyrhizobium]|uniref:hypothetical protein n=1 Tax=unclassified Bradyrhizobium TaxID=2631580 RepID=UPI0020B234BC|nr:MULTISPECIES: hypothetical protein [unclassified Bradyrhizobium]MCP3401977.1 hypothetical protein [Bradyrhizobium sp. CCGB20]MCP3410462.1 hypothetical protein [Bradyrhizobium sp. CCGB01]
MAQRLRPLKPLRLSSNLLVFEDAEIVQQLGLQQLDVLSLSDLPETPWRAAGNDAVAPAEPACLGPDEKENADEGRYRHAFPQLFSRPPPTKISLRWLAD